MLERTHNPRTWRSLFYLTDSKALLLVNDSQIFFDSHWIQVLGGHSLQLKGILLEILETIAEKDRISRINLLDAILTRNAIKSICTIGRNGQTLNLVSTTMWNVWLIKSFIFVISPAILALESSTFFRILCMSVLTLLNSFLISPRG